MKLLTTEQLEAVMKWYGKSEWFWLEREAMNGVMNLITAECREHGYAGIEDAYQVLIEKEGK